MKIDICIIGALDTEVEGLISLLDSHEVETVGGIKCHLGILDGKCVCIARCGVGKVFAAMCAEAMIVKYSPSLIINTGVGGALSDKLMPTDTVIADKLCQHDMDTSPLGDPKGLISGINKIYFEADKRAVEILKSSAERLSINAFVGTVASGDKFVAHREDKQNIIFEFSAMACEMEGCAIAQVAFVNSVPFAVIRAISDSADGDASMDYASFLPIAAKNSTALTRALVASY